MKTLDEALSKMTYDALSPSIREGLLRHFVGSCGMSLKYRTEDKNLLLLL